MKLMLLTFDNVYDTMSYFNVSFSLGIEILKKYKQVTHLRIMERSGKVPARYSQSFDRTSPCTYDVNC